MKKWIKEKEKALAKSLLKWKFEKEGQTPPSDAALEAGAEHVVGEANRIFKERGEKALKKVKAGAKKVFEDK